MTSGSKYQHAWFYGGRLDGANPMSPSGDLLRRFGPVEDTGGKWDAAILPLPHAGERPAPREGHTTEFVRALNEQVYFGGRKADGSLSNETWMLHGSQVPVTGSEYTYPWRRPTLVGEIPGARWRHTAVAISDTEMVVFGGIKKSGGVEVATGDMWRMWRDSFGQWKWTEVVVSGGTPPAARFGHAAAWDRDQRRMLIYGGAVDPVNPEATDATMYTFTFNPTDGSSGAWSTVAVSEDPTHGSPGARFGHTMSADTVFRSGPMGTARTGLLFGGKASDGTYDSKLWVLWLGSSGLRWEAHPTPPTATITPPGRIWHAAVFDLWTERLLIHGGEPPPGETPDKHVYLRQWWASSDWSRQWRKWAASTTAMSGHTMVMDQNLVLHIARIPELYDPASNTWTEETVAALHQATYPVTFAVPGGPGAGGRVITATATFDARSRYLDIPARGAPLPAWQTMPQGQLGFFPQTGVLFRPDSIMVAGGTSTWPNVVGTTKTLGVLSVNNSWNASADMIPRYYHDLVILPNGTVLATGGTSTTAGTGPVFRPQIWDPRGNSGTGSWTAADATGLATSTAIRDYHSTALLLPDGRVLCAGGSTAPDYTTADIFCPPYLFESSGGFASRPEIQSAPPAIHWGRNFTVCSPQAAEVQKVALLRPGATTHAFDQNQRYAPLEFQRETNPPRLLVRAPASADSAPPGYYMLFLVGRGENPDVPSIAKWVQVVGASGDDICDVTPPAPTPVMPEIIGPTSAIVTWQEPADDGAIAFSGLVEEFAMRYRAMAPIENESDWSIATWVTPLPSPVAVGYVHDTYVQGLQPCTEHSFVARAKDDRPGWPWSAIEQVTFRTLCSGGGGGGGMGSSQRPVEAGEERDAGGTVAARDDGAPSSSGAPPTTRGSSLGAGRGAAANNLRGCASTDLLVVEQESDDAGLTVRLGRLEREAVPGLTSEDHGVVLQRRGADGAWRTRSQHPLALSEGCFAIPAAAEPRRSVFLDGLEPAQMFAELAPRGRALSLTRALHSSGGEVTASIREGVTPALATGEWLELHYATSEGPATGASEWALTVHRAAAGRFTQREAGRMPAPALPTAYALHQNEPNPFGGGTRIRFDLPEAAEVSIEVFDLAGRRVATAAAGRFEAGAHAVAWNRRHESGAPVAPGVYLYRLRAGALTEQRRMIVLP